MEVSLPNQARFGAFRLDLKAGELCKGTRKILLQEQPFQILLMLVDHPGELVTRDEIRRRLWPNDTIVEFDHSIHTAIKKLRQALGDSAEKPHYVETVTRRGYRLLVPVERVETSPADPPTPSAAEIPPSTASRTANLTGRRISHYRVLEMVGGGGMGVVYKAEDIKLGRGVALKFLTEELVNDTAAMERFEREARAASALNHPNICTIYEVDEHEGQPFIVMELLEGHTLREMIAAAGRCGPGIGRLGSGLELATFLNVALQITGGLEAAHTKSIIHRDIKPANIFITTSGQTKILDFGLAKLQEFEITDQRVATAAVDQARGESNLNLTRTGVAMGTAPYMSPEQVRGDKLDARTDLFSLGLVLYEMAVGKRAFDGETAPILHAAILNDTPKSVRELNQDIPSSLERIIDKALEKDRESRYQSAADMTADLKEEADALHPMSNRTTKLWQVVAAGVIGLVVTGLVFWVWSSRLPALPELKQRQLTTNTTENPVWGGAISPDGKYLAYSDAEGIHIKLMATGDLRSLPQPQAFKGSHVDWSFRWFPDSTRLIANAAVAGQGDSVWTTSVMGGPPRKLRDDAYAWGVSPEGAQIAFTTNPDRYGDRELWLMDSDGGRAHKLYDVDQNSGFTQVEWSPHGGRVAYTKKEEALDKVDTVLETRDLKGGTPIRVFSGVPLSRLWEFRWLPDGRMIYLLVEPDINLYSCNYWQQRVDPQTGESRGRPLQLTHWAGFCMDHTSVTADGQRLVFKRWWVQRSVYVADVEPHDGHITTPTRLTHSEGNELPMAWTADSNAVLFVSNRTGPWGIFKQALHDSTAEVIVTGLEDSVIPSISPDGRWVLYVAYPKQGGSSKPDQLLRVPVNGGTPQLVLSGRIYGQRCAKSPAILCAMAERTKDDKQLIFTAFDPLNGRGRELARLGTDPNADYVWDLSPDGTRIAVHKSREGAIQILGLDGQAPLEITATGSSSLETLNWAADGRGLFAASRTQESSVLLYVDLLGNTRTVWEHQGTLGNESAGTSGIPSPDGRRLAMMDFTLSGNMWAMDNF